MPVTMKPDYGQVYARTWPHEKEMFHRDARKLLRAICKELDAEDVEIAALRGGPAVFGEEWMTWYFSQGRCLELIVGGDLGCFGWLKSTAAHPKRRGDGVYVLARTVDWRQDGKWRRAGNRYSPNCWLDPNLTAAELAALIWRTQPDIQRLTEEPRPQLTLF